MKAITKETYTVFWRHARRYRSPLAAMVVSSVLATVISTAIPLFYKQFFDILANSHAQSPGMLINTLTRIILIVLILQAIIWLFYRVSFFSNVYFQTHVMADLINTSFEYLHKHSYQFFANRFVGALVRKVNRLVDAFEAITDRLYYDLLPLAIRIIGILLVVFYRNTTLGIILASWILIYVAINYIFTIYKLKYDEANARINTEVTARLADTVTNNINIKIFSALGSELAGFQGLTEEQRKITTFTWHLGGYLEAVQGVFMIALEFFVFYIAIRFWNQGLLTIGDFVLIQDYLMQIFTRLWDFGRFFRDIYKHLANAEEMVEILRTPHEIQDAPNAKDLVVDKGNLKFTQVTFSYGAKRPVIQNFSLDIAPGEKVGLVGPSGAGKSTLMALLLRFYDPQEGSILIDGQNIANVSQESLRNAIALVPQDPILFHRTLIDNIRYGRPGATKKEIMEAAGLAHCDEFISSLPQGYQTYVGERGIKLSGGERQRVAIARAILKNAPILLLDEATSSLDSHSEAMIQDALSYLMERKTSIVIAHRLSTIMKMDRIIVVKHGKITEEGTHTQLLDRPQGVYKKLWELQAGGFIA